MSLGYTSLSSDVYEWRAEGVDGCVVVQGCLRLITSGAGGYMNLLIGATPSGDNVFFTTASQLVGTDNDTALDIYDARVDGGFPPPTQLTECEGSACHSPVAAPIDTTPGSFAFSGSGNVIAPTVVAKKTRTVVDSSRRNREE